MDISVNDTQPLELISKTSSQETGPKGDAPKMVSNDMSKLREEAPEFFEFLIESLAMSICRKSDKDQKELAKIRKEYERQ